MEPTSLIIHESAILARYEFSFVEHRNVNGSQVSCFKQRIHDILLRVKKYIFIYNPNKVQNDIT